MAGQLKGAGSGRDHSGPLSSATTAQSTSNQLCAKIIVSNIHPAVKEQELVSFLQSKIVSCAVTDFQELCSRNGAAVVTLSTPVDVRDLQKLCKTNLLQGQVVQIEAALQLEDADTSRAPVQSGAQSPPVSTCAAASQSCREALVSGLTPVVTDDYLINLLECATQDCEVKEVRRGTKTGVAVVVFENPVDVDEIQSFCSDNAEDGVMLSVEPVPDRGAVLVRNPPPEINNGCFKFYLSNTRRSGGSKGVTIERDDHNLYLLARFDSLEVAKRVVGKKHTLEGHVLQLELFDTDLNVLPSPDDGDVDVSSRSEQPASQRSASSHRTDVAAATQGHMAQSAPHGRDTTLQITKGLKNIKLQEGDGDTENRPVEKHGKRTWLKSEEQCGDFSDQVGQSLEDHQTIHLNSKAQYFLEHFCSRDLQSSTGPENAQIEMRGQVCEIKGCRMGVGRAARRLKDIIRKLCYRRAVFTHPALAFLLQARREMWDQMMERVQHENHCIITELPDPRFKEADTDNEEWGQWSAAVINTFPLSGQVNIHITEGEAVDLKVDAAVVCYNRNRLQKRQPSMQGTGARPKSSHQPRGIRVAPSGALPCKALIQVDLSHYFAEGTDYKDALHALIEGIFRECEGHHFTSLALPVLGVDVLTGKDPQPIDETTTGIARSCCEALASRGQDRYGRHSQQSSVRDVFLCSRRAACLHGLSFALEDQDGPSLPCLPPFTETFQCLSCQPHGGGQTVVNMNTISVSLGDISTVQADVLVVPLDIDIDLDLDESRLTRSLVVQGGQSVQHSIQHRPGFWGSVKCVDDNNEELADHHVLVGDSGYLNTKHVFYVYIPPWGHGVLKILRERVQKCLRKASERRCRSVAMTALGVGKLGYPVEFAARTSMAAVADFMQQEKTTLENVNFVIYPTDQDCFVAFSAEENEWMKHRASTSDDHQLPIPVDPGHSEHSATGSSQSYAQAARGRGKRGRGNGRGRGRNSSNPHREAQSLETGGNSSPRTKLWESVCQRGYSLDPNREDAVSLFILSDSEEHRQAAVEDIATGIVDILGPAKREESRGKVAGDGRRESDGQGGYSGYYQWKWNNGF